MTNFYYHKLLSQFPVTETIFYLFVLLSKSWWNEWKLKYTKTSLCIKISSGKFTVIVYQVAVMVNHHHSLQSPDTCNVCLIFLFLSFQIIALTYATIFFKHLVVRDNDYTKQRAYFVFMFSLRAWYREINSKLIPWVSKGRQPTLKKIQKNLTTWSNTTCCLLLICKMPGQNSQDNTPNFGFVVHTGLRAILTHLVKDTF